MRMHRFIRPLVLALMLLSIPALSFGGVAISVSIGPPPIPVYTQPLCPGEGYIWTPGYWAWGDEGYYWVPGTWVTAPEPGYLWTPGYWGWGSGAYLWHAGYWGPHVGFYGGINYGFGYPGSGFYGGEWRGRNFYYNRSVSNVNVTNVTNVYNKTVIVHNNNRVSYNGGNGGIHAEPNSQQRQWDHERHVEPTRAQSEHFQAAARDRNLLARNNGGKPSIAATDRPGQFNGRGVVGARAAGGNVNREALNATPKNMPARNANEGRVNDARANGGRTNEGTARGTNVPRPPNATNERGAATANASPRNVPKPNNAPRAETSPNNTRENGNARNVPKPPSASNNSRETTARSTATPERSVATPHNTPTPHENAPRPPANTHQSSPRPAANTAHESAPRPTTHESAPRPASTPHESAPRPSAAHESAPRSAPQQHNAPAQHSEPSHGGGDKPKR